MYTYKIIPLVNQCFLFAMLLIVILLPMSSLQAKRMPPASVETLHFQGISYEVSGMGIVVARDEKNNRVLWENTIYTVSYNPLLEKDVQDTYIRKLEISDGSLLVTNEKKAVYRVDLTTGKVLRTLSAGTDSDFHKIYTTSVVVVSFLLVAFIVYRFFLRR